MKTLQFNSITNFKFQTMKTMKTMKTSAFYALLSIAMIGCSDDDATPEVINDEEVITTVILTLTPESGDQVVLTTLDLDGDGPDEPVTTVVGNFSENTIYDGTVAFLDESGEEVILTTIDLDGDGPDEPVTTVSGSFSENTVYTGAARFLNETETPAEEITDEVVEEADEHQVFYTVGEGLNITTTYLDSDSNGNPLGVSITLETGEASSGSLTVTLRHEPVKPNDGLDSAGGETDIATSFDVSIQ